MDLNLDAGEMMSALEDGSEPALYRLVTRINIACGGHAGDDESMRLAVQAARDAGILVGAHPSYPDRANFGRKPLSLPLAEVRIFTRDQVLRLKRIAENEGMALDHVKAHGALYNQLSHELPLAEAFAEGVRDAGGPFKLLALAGSPALNRWRDLGFPTLAEAFADRRYSPDGRLAPRGEPGAMLTTASLVLENLKTLPRDYDTLCVHGDNPAAKEILLAMASLAVR